MNQKCAISIGYLHSTGQTRCSFENQGN